MLAEKQVGYSVEGYYYLSLSLSLSLCIIYIYIYMGAVDWGCSGWRAQVEQQAGHSHRLFKTQSVSRFKSTSQATTPGFHYQ